MKGKAMSLTRAEAENLIDKLKAKEISLGRPENTWYTYKNHVYGVAKVAEILSTHLKNINPEKAYISGLLHDISRTDEDREQRFHGILGYEKLIDKDTDAARASILHMFPFNEIMPYEKCTSLFFNNKADYDFVRKYIENTTLTDEDLLIQLSDVLANKDGFVTIEQRFQEMLQRRSFDNVEESLAASYRLKAYFDDKIGEDVYKLLKIF